MNDAETLFGTGFDAAMHAWIVHGRALIAARLDEHDNVVAGNKAFRQVVGPVGDAQRAALADCFSAPGGRLELVVSAFDRPPVANLLRARATDEVVTCVVYPVPDGRLLLGVRGNLHRAFAESTAALTAELTEAMRELKRSNAELEVMNQRVIELSRTDPLTGVANRRYLSERFAAFAAHAQRHGRPLAVVMADLDHFKRVNDEHGHAVGDEVLQHFAALLLRSSRVEDLVARYGGEEFVAVLPDTDCAAATHFAERVRAAFEAAEAAPGVRCTGSFGVVEWRQGEDEHAVIERADRAMYRAKVAGRNRVMAG